MFDEEKLPGCLVPKVRVRDEKGKELAFGVSASVLRERLQGELLARRERAANAEWEMTGGEFWSFGEIPEEVSDPMSTGIVYPALVDEGETVGMRAFLTREEASESHRAGCVRLFLLEHAEHLAQFRKRLPLRPEVKLFLGGMNVEWEEELLRTVSEGVLWERGKELLRDEEGFVAAAKRGKGELHATVGELGETMREVAAARDRVREWVEYFRPQESYASVIEDVEEELMWLFRPQWMWRAGWSRVRRYQRYLHALEERFQRLESQPLTRDEEKQAQVWPLWERWLGLWQGEPDQPWLWDAGWMLAEWRIALFAPSQPREGKVSGKRIEKMLEGRGFVNRD